MEGKLERGWKGEGRWREIGKSGGKEKDGQGDAIGGLRFEDKKGRHAIMTEIKLYDRNKEKRDKEMEKEREKPLKTGLERVSKS